MIPAIRYFDIADAINSCSTLTQQERAALRGRIKKFQGSHP
jgi:hypothetical protein